MTAGDTRLSRLAESAKWFVFAVSANDRRRAAYANLISRTRSSDIASRRDAVSQLPHPSLTIDRQLGFATGDAATFDGTSDMVAEVQRLSETIFGEDGSGKPYLANAPLAGLPLSSAVFRFALNDQLVASATEYLGMVPVLAGIYALRSTYVAGPPAGSQLFHCDWETVRQVKVFVHCGRVNVEDGPLTAITAVASRRLKNKINYRYGGRGFRVHDEQVHPIVADDEIHTFAGPAGAVTLMDTSSCFHFGSRITQPGGQRLVVQFQYMTPASFDLLLKYRAPRHLDSGPSSDSAIRRLVLGGLQPGGFPSD